MPTKESKSNQTVKKKYTWRDSVKQFKRVPKRGTKEYKEHKEWIDKMNKKYSKTYTKK